FAPPPAPPPGLGGHFAREAQLAGEREAAGGDGSPPANGGREGDELHDEELEETPSAPNGGPEADGPAHTGPDEEGVHDEEDRLGDDLHDADDPDADLHDDALDEDEIPDGRDLDEDALDEDEIPDERDLDEDALERRPAAGTGQRDPGPALSPPARPPISPPPATAARAPLPPRPVPPRRPPQGPILPPYEKSRPGGPNLDREGPSRRARLLALGGGALAIAVVAFGVVQLVGGDDAAEDPTPQAPVSQPGGSAPTAGDPAAGATIVPGDVTVAVLNGTSVAGLAAGLGDRLESEGFNLGNITNSADQERAESVVLYATGAEEEARDVGRRLRINQREPIDPETQTRAGDASVVVVVVGADLDR
ncbi:MAG: LytR C-terminal domain-containing protein, partial [Thermoleophilaceae bacterium]